MAYSTHNYIPFEELIQSPQKWQDFVRELAPSFKTPRFPKYTEAQYSKDNTWQAVSALNGRVPMASLINPDGEGKPIIGSEKPLDMHGEMPTFGNEVVFSSKEFNRIQDIEDAIDNNVVNPSEMLKYIKSYMERLYVGPLISIDKIFFEAFSNGISTITKEDSLSGLSFSIDWQLQKWNVATPWSDETAKGIDDLYNLYWAIRNAKGVSVDHFTMNKKTLNQLLRQPSVKEQTSSYFTKGNKSVKWVGVPSLDTVNVLLDNNFGLPPIQVEDYSIDIYNADGITVKKTISAFQDGRVTAHLGNIIGPYIWTPAAEQRRPDRDGTVYQTMNNVLVSTRGKRGKVTYESELSAIAVPTLNDQMGILTTDATTGNTALPTA